MIYHFKLMNHFTGKSPLNFPFYLHRSLGKMAHQVKAHPTNILGRLSYHGLIQLLIQVFLKRTMAWLYFLFWNGFETDLQQEEMGKSPAKKSSTLRSGRSKRRDISPAAATEHRPSSSKMNKVKRNLDFSEKGQEVKTTLKIS